MVEDTELVFPGDVQDGDLAVSVRRYRPQSGSQSAVGRNAQPVALVFAHCLGTHKETWLPTVEHLFGVQSTKPDSSIFIAEAWVVDTSNHGHAAALNEQVLLDHPDVVSAHQGARTFLTLINSGLIQRGTKIVAVGHSGGACATVLSTIGFSARDMPYTSMIIVEPGMFTPDVVNNILREPTVFGAIMEAVKTRRDIWPSRSEAREWMKKRSPWKRWDARVLDLFIEHGTRDLPTAAYPDRTDGVTLSCTREQDAHSYDHFQDGIDSLEQLVSLCSMIPVHCIFGGKLDVLTEGMHDDVVDASQGRKMASVTTVQGAGHLLAQEAPDGLAAAIWAAVVHESNPQKSRL